MKTDEKGRPLTYWGGLDESKKQTAVEFAVEKLEQFIPSGNQIAIGLIFQQALEMEKEQIKDAWDNGCGYLQENSQQYYNETFKQQEQ